MTEDKILSISTSLSIRPEDVAHKSFNVVKRGYDPDQIRVYLEQIANEFAHLLERQIVVDLNFQWEFPQLPAAGKC